MTLRERITRVGDVERHETTVGHARLWFYVDHSTRHIDLASLRVAQTKRGKGEGTRALAHVLALADRLHYSVKLAASPLDRRTTTAQLVRFYGHHGFEPTGHRINSYGDPEMLRPARDRSRRRRRHP